MSHEVWQLFEKHVSVSEMIANIVSPLPFRVEIVNMYCFHFVHVNLFDWFGYS